MTTTADILDEYGQALRLSWGDIDGRSEKYALMELSYAIREHGNDDLDVNTVFYLRAELGVCPLGRGHWDYFCEDEGCKDE